MIVLQLIKKTIQSCFHPADQNALNENHPRKTIYKIVRRLRLKHYEATPRRLKIKAKGLSQTRTDKSQESHKSEPLQYTKISWRTDALSW